MAPNIIATSWLTGAIHFPSKGGSILARIFDKTNQYQKSYHPTQKPVSLLKYLIKTYTDKYDLVLDNCMGGGSTGVASKVLSRNFIGMELDDYYFNVAKKRIQGVKELVNE